ncbi:type IV pilin protein [Dyella acidisoli]|uniref:Type IV pilin n=1 Tax=Dyella acidisoli TaxID=1867834 RepID=A0ABQ5XTF3_9GAMM|nr:type IV pilin [Dyella acidisoli]
MIELMIVVAIVAILSAIAIASYSKYIQTSRRTDAYSALSQDQGIMERCYQQTYNYSYAYNGNSGNTSGVNCTQIATTSQNSYYTLAAAAGPAGTSTSSYVITATAVGAQAKDTACATLTVDNTNKKGWTPTTTAAGTCWQN